MSVKKIGLFLLITTVLIGLQQHYLLVQGNPLAKNANSVSSIGFTDPVRRIESIAQRVVKHLIAQPHFAFPKNYKITSEMLYKLETMPVLLSYTAEINAWTDGDVIYIASAMFDFAKSDSELAIILAHEMAHVIKNHKGIRIISSTTAAAMSTISDAFVAGLGNLVNLGSKLVLLKYDRHQENEADLLALQIINNAQYDMSDAIKIYERLDMNMPTIRNFLNSHPSSKQRVVNLKQLALKIKKLQLQVIKGAAGRSSSNKNVTRQQSETKNVAKPFPQKTEDKRTDNSAENKDAELDDLLDGYWGGE